MHTAGDRKVRPTSLYRRNTPQYMSSKSGSAGRSNKEKESREEEDRGVVGESFPQFCTYCEKQITSSSTNFLYCSEACRRHDLSTHSRNGSTSTSPISPSFPSLLPYTRSFSTIYPTDGPDIIPRASPTTLRPRSNYSSDQYSTSSYSTTAKLSHSGHKPSNSTSSSALDSLRELSAALDYNCSESKETQGSRSGSDAESDPSAPSSPTSRSASGVWSYMTFASSSTTGAAAKQVSRSYTQPQVTGSSYGGDYRVGYNYSTGASTGISIQRYAAPSYTTTVPAVTRGMMDRPLPPRSGGYGHRPQSMDLVTPYSSAI